MQTVHPEKEQRLRLRFLQHKKIKLKEKVEYNVIVFSKITLLKLQFVLRCFCKHFVAGNQTSANHAGFFAQLTAFYLRIAVNQTE